METRVELDVEADYRVGEEDGPNGDSEEEEDDQEEADIRDMIADLMFLTVDKSGTEEV